MVGNLTETFCRIKMPEKLISPRAFLCPSNMCFIVLPSSVDGTECCQLIYTCTIYFNCSRYERQEFSTIFIKDSQTLPRKTTIHESTLCYIINNFVSHSSLF